MIRYRLSPVVVCRAVGLVAGVSALLCGRPGWSQFDEEADLIPGLVAVYEAGGERQERIDADLTHVWDAAAPDARLPAGPFTAHWSSGLLLREEAEYTFHAYLQGEVTVELDGEPVLAAVRDEPGWVSGEPVALSFGLLDLAVAFRKTGESARVQLYWSSDRFPLEPIPPHQLFRETGRPELSLVETGRQLFAAHRCNRCHVREHDPPAPPAPGLFHVTSGLNREWLTAKLLDQTPDAAHARMPSFGFDEEEAAAIAAWIEYLAQPAELMATPEPKRDKGDDAPTVAEAGRTLLFSIGCLACHTVGELGESGPFGGGDLTHIGTKRTADWINTWLARPERLNVQHRMPLFKLTSNERALLATTLAGLGRDNARFDEITPAGKQETDLVRRGRQLAEAARCAACHKIPAMETQVAGIPTLEKLIDPASGQRRPIEDWNNTCLSDRPDRQRNRPAYRRLDVEAVAAYVNSRLDPLTPLPPLARGEHVLEERNCLGCHERDLTKGIVPIAGAVANQVPALRGQSQALIPPALTAIGDKLYDAPLTQAVSGEQKTMRLPWLQVRMPRFIHDDDAKSELVRYLVDHDRIPADAPASTLVAASAKRRDGRPAAASVDEQTLVIGRTLTGSGGFNCVACHKFGDYEPRNVALGTKGSDLKRIDERLRVEFFHRWTRDPLRVVPGMEMPSIKKPVDGVLGGNLDAQLAAVWAAINDPNFTAPPNPAQVEQHLVLQPGDPPRILRDVFTVSDANGGGYVARGLAVGFENGHSLLLDLDTLCVRGWTFGDFAQQRTEGKSWYWDLAGVNAVTGLTERSEIVLVPTSEDASDPAAYRRPKSARLIRYDSDPESVRIVSRFSYDIEDHETDVTLIQTLAPLGDDTKGDAGIGRLVAATGVPEGYRLVLDIEPRTGGVSTVFPRATDQTDAQLPVRTGDPPWEWLVLYHSRLAAPRLTPQPRPELPGNDAPVTTLPGFIGQRLKLPSSIMPTAITWTGITGTDTAGTDTVRTAGGRLAFTSLKGQVYLATDISGDGLEDTLTEFETGLAAPFGLLADGDTLLVAHKPELLRLQDTDGDGRADVRLVAADGWGYTDNYHDWTTGPVRDREGNIYLALGSDYQQNERPAERARWRGKVLKLDPSGHIEPFAHELRFPQGIALDPHDRLFVTDQQGVANTFNELNYILPGSHYGVEAMHEETRDAPETPPAVQIPHPWTRSVNGLMFLPADVAGPLAPFAGHGLGAEYNSRFLIRFTLQEVDGVLQGATYYFTRPTWDEEAQTFLGPMAVALGPTGDLYVGSIHDSGWLGGQNTGDIVRLSPTGDELPNGIRELRATPDGFEVEFLHPIDATTATNAANYNLSGYTRVWEGSYATPDSGRYSPQVKSLSLSDDGRLVTLTVDELRESYVYELNCTKLGDNLFPATAHYTMNRIPPR